jgi:uncharacterized membrane protein YhiD involved in acid resistance
MAIGSKKYHAQIWKTRALLALVVIFCILLSISLFKRVSVQQDMVERRKEVEVEKMRLEARHQEVMNKAHYIQSAEGIEAEIRKNFDVAKEGESVIILLDTPEEEDMDTTSTQRSVQVEISPWWRFW